MNSSAPQSDPDEDASGSMSVLLRDWLANEDELAQRIQNSYFPRLKGLAQKVLSRYPGAATEADDVAQSAMKSLCLFMRKQSTDDHKDRDDIWRLLCRMVVRKAARRKNRQTRGLKGGKVSPVTDFEGDDRENQLLDALRYVSIDEFELLIKDAIEHLDESLQPTALLTLEGHTQLEISDKLGCSRRTIARKFEFIKKLMGMMLSDEP